MTDAKALTISRYHEVEDCDPIPEDIQSAARRIICANSVGETLDEQVADAQNLMRMLGIFPGEEAEDYPITDPGRMR